MLDQLWDIFGALAECGNENRNNVDAIVEVLAKVARLDFFQNVLVRCGDQANIDIYALLSANTLEAHLLDNSKHLRLGTQR